MKNLFQVYIRNNLLLAVVVGLAASFTGTPTSQLNSNFTTSLGNTRFLQPIIIPNLTIFSKDLFPTTAKINETQKIKVGNQDYFIKKIFYPDEAISQESKLDEKFSKEENRANDNSIRFSSKYSSASETPDDSEEQVDSSEESEEERKESVESTTADSSEELFEGNQIQSKHDVVSEKYNEDYSEPPSPTRPYFESREEENAEIVPYSNVNESREAEEEISSTTNEPYTELRSPTSFKNSQYPDEEFENYETSSSSTEEKDSSIEEEEKESKISPDDYHDSTLKNYHSVQTPLSQIRFRGPSSLKADYDKTRTRIIPPIKRHPIAHNWPYSRAGLKTQDKKSNEILDSEEYNSDEWESEVNKASTSKKLLDLERAVGVDEKGLRENVNKKLNHVAGSSRQEDKHLRTAEIKDQQYPLYQSLKQYRVDEEEEPNPKPKFSYNSGLKYNAWPPRPSIKPQTQLFSKTESANIKPTNFNITKELTPNFQGHQFLGPIVFNQGIEEYEYVKTTSPSNTFSKELEKKEHVDQQKLRNEKIQNLILSAGRKPVPAQSFNHEEESDEMYNQILANIQSVFGLRTQPLKAIGGRKSNQELHSDENRAFTWAVPPRKRATVKESEVKSEY